jgi:hypothetical protein
MFEDLEPGVGGMGCCQDRIENSYSIQGEEFSN